MNLKCVTRICLVLLASTFGISVLHAGLDVEMPPYNPTPPSAPQPQLQLQTQPVNQNSTAPAPSFDTKADNPLSIQNLPDALKPWQDWAIRDDINRGCPSPYNDASVTVPYWSSQLNLAATANAGAQFNLSVQVLRRCWLALPGDDRFWPQHVLLNNQPATVVLHGTYPAIQIAPGQYTISGNYNWTELPTRFALPKEIGILNLTLDGKPVQTPVWGEDGYLILQQNTSVASERDFLQVKIARLIKDDVPLRLETQIMLDVSGHSREELLKTVLPANWKLCSVESHLPIAIDENGNAKVQVRPGPWEITLSAFALSDLKEVGYSPGAKPAVAHEYIGFLPNPNLRLAKIDDLSTVDTTQSDYPNIWGTNFPVYSWDTSQPFHIKESLGGAGEIVRSGLEINRNLWLDETGTLITFRDHITAHDQQNWRLNSASDHTLGSISVSDSPNGLLITQDPANGAAGIELRNTTLNLIATGTIANPNQFHAAGWQGNIDRLSATLDLPPGWRLFAAIGPDRCYGSWIGSWTLFYLFLLLVLSVGAARLFGLWTGVLAFVAFGASCTDAFAPSIIWPLLLIPIALLRFTQNPSLQRNLVVVWKWVLGAILAFFLGFFWFVEIVSTIYPCLDQPSTMMESMGFNGSSSFSSIASIQDASYRSRIPKYLPNLSQDDSAKVQTGPAIPSQQWRTVRLEWVNSLSNDEQLRLVLIPPWLNQILNLVKVGLTFALLLALLEFKELRRVLIKFSQLPAVKPGTATATVTLLILCSAPQYADAQSQVIPPPEMLQSLRDSLTAPSTAFPNAAAIAQANLVLDGNTIKTHLEVHAIVETVVPIPGRLPTWSPQTVNMDGKPTRAIGRSDGFLWVDVPAGNHQVDAVGLIPSVSEWAWTAQLQPHFITVTSNDWSWIGLRPGGTMDGQIFFTRVAKNQSQSDYGHQKLEPLIVIDRRLEFGHAWLIHSKVQRLSAGGQATSLQVPLLPNEKLISANFVVENGMINIALQPDQTEENWLSEIEPVSELKLASRKTDTWIEKWELVTSPLWNVSLSGLAPVYEDDNFLTPTWHPWPGESATIHLTRSKPIQGTTVTINQVNYIGTVGSHRLDIDLSVELKTSIGQDISLDFPLKPEITSFQLNQTAYPVRINEFEKGFRLIVSLSPGVQKLQLKGRFETPMTSITSLPPIRFNKIDSAEALSPLTCANSTLTLTPNASQFILWSWGPTRGSFVALWTGLAFGIVLAWVLGRLPIFYLNSFDWFLLIFGLTQTSLFLLPFIALWFALIQYRPVAPRAVRHNLDQAIFLGTGAVIIILLTTVHHGLVLNPDSWIIGGAYATSYSSDLSWYQARGQEITPSVGYLGIPRYWYRIIMLIWALWLANKVLAWFTWGAKRVINARKEEMESGKPAAPYQARGDTVV